MKKNKFMSVFLILVTAYIFTLLFLYLYQRNLIYFPDNRPAQPVAYGVSDMSVIAVQTEDGLLLEGWYKPPAKTGNKPVIVLFHGNAMHPGDRAFKARIFMDQGYGFLLAGYRGYGGNPGKPSEQGFYNDARAYIDWLISQAGISVDDVVLYGESLGTGVVVQMAGEYPAVKAVMLESPYTSLVEIGQRRFFFIPVRFLMKDQFNSVDKIESVQAPLLIIQGMKDRIVPYHYGQNLFQVASEPKAMESFSSGGHNDLYSYGAGERMLFFLNDL